MRSRSPSSILRLAAARGSRGPCHDYHIPDHRWAIFIDSQCICFNYTTKAICVERFDAFVCPGENQEIDVSVYSRRPLYALSRVVWLGCRSQMLGV